MVSIVTHAQFTPCPTLSGDDGGRVQSFVDACAGVISDHNNDEWTGARGRVGRCGQSHGSEVDSMSRSHSRVHNNNR